MKLNTDKMQAVSAASYLTAPDAVLYRSIMRILYNSKEAYRSQLSIDEILSELHEHEEFESYAADKIKSSMDMLTNWGCVSPMQDPRKVRTIEEYQNRIYRYSLTEEAVIIERMTIELENIFSESNTLPESLLERIHSSLKEIKTVLEIKSNKDLNEWWRNLQEDFKRLSRNYSDYIHSFCSVSGEKMINSVDFLIHKDNFIQYLRSFFYDEIIPKEIRTVILKWITSAFQNRNRTGITDFGKKFRLLTSEKIITVHFDDGELTMPAYTFEFEGE